MSTLINFLVGFIALQHFGFLVLEMFLWTKSIGLKIFKLDPDFAAQTSAMAANQGLYNGFLVAGLVWALLSRNTPLAFDLKVFFLSCVLTAGLYGAFSVGKTILYVQAFPAALTLALLCYTYTTKV